MSTIINKSETFFREIRTVDLYPADSLPYENNVLGYAPDAGDRLYTFRVNPEDYERNLPTKKRGGNHFFSVDIGFPLLELQPELREELYHDLNRTGFCVVLNSNTERMIVGNAREPLTVEILDGIKDNGSGTDQFNISIAGETIVQPKGISL